MNSQSMESLVRDVLKKMTTAETPTSSTAGHASTGGSNIDTSNVVSPDGSGAVGALTAADYPLARKRPDLVKTGTGKSLDDITLENILNGGVKLEDMRVTPEVLRYQAEIARSAGYGRLAMNLERAAELTAVPDERILEIYTALRPYRSSQADLHSIADELENKYRAKICADYVREAATLYQQRKKLKGDF